MVEKKLCFFFKFSSLLMLLRKPHVAQTSSIQFKISRALTQDKRKACIQEAAGLCKKIHCNRSKKQKARDLNYRMTKKNKQNLCLVCAVLLGGSDWESESGLIKDECEECAELPLSRNASLLRGGVLVELFGWTFLDLHFIWDHVHIPNA